MFLAFQTTKEVRCYFLPFFFATAHGVTYYKNWSHIWLLTYKAVKGGGLLTDGLRPSPQKTSYTRIHTHTYIQSPVQSMLLSGIETCCLAPAALKSLEGFHVKAAHRMTGVLPKLTSGRWKQPKTKTVLVATGLHTIEYYVQVLRACKLNWVQDGPILKTCRSAKRMRGSPPRLYWSEQPMELDAASGGAPLTVAAEQDREDGGRAP